ncbi:hypothetical protein G9A89_003333 [Geosiphon pyriformis]|nr:hypothetical protein G9A89_003333 [Geosiphon pyriformis]
MYSHTNPSSSSNFSASSPPVAPYFASNNNPAAPPPARTSNKADQIVQNFYSKVAQIVTHSRLLQYDLLSSTKATSNTNTSSSRQPTQQAKKTNRWFNLELEDSDVFKEDIKFWRQAATTSSVPPQPMVIEFFLDTKELAQNQILVLTDENLRKHKVDLQNLSGSYESVKKTNIMLESWELTLSHPLPDPPPDLPIVYKKSIAFFRSLYAYVRLMPTYRLFKRLRGMKSNNSMKIDHRFVIPPGRINGAIGLDIPIIIGETAPISSNFTFGSIDTPFGVFTLNVIFRKNCDFHIDDNSEAVLSSKFEEMDENYFTPTMARFYQEEERQRRQADETDGRRRSYPTNLYQKQLQIQKSPSRSTSVSPHNPGPLFSETPPIEKRGSPTPNTDTEISNSVSRLPRSSSSSSSSLSSHHRPQPTLGSNFSNFSAPSLSIKNVDQGKNPQALHTGTSGSLISRSGRDLLHPPISPISGNRPNVTLVSPFKYPSLSSSPTYPHIDNIPSPTFSDRVSSSPIQRSPSSVSLHQRYAYASSPTSARSLPIGSGNMLSSSLRSNSSSGSPSTFPKKFSSSFGHRYERPVGISGGREKEWNVGGRRTSKGSLLTNRSDDTTSDRGSYNSSFFVSQDYDDVGEFVRMVDSREPLKLNSVSLSRLDWSGSPSNKISGSVYRSRLALSRFQQLKESHNNFSESLSSSAVLNNPQNLTPPLRSDNDTLGVSTNLSVSSESTTSSIGRSPTNQPTISLTLQENGTNKNLDTVERPSLPQPMTIPQRGISDSRGAYRPRRSSSLTSVGSGSRVPAGMLLQPENTNTIGIYSSYPEDIGELRRAGSSSSLTSLHRQYHYHPHHQRVIREDSSPGSSESIMKREGSGDEMVSIGQQSSTGSLNVGTLNAISGLPNLKERTNRRDSGGSIGSGGLLRLHDDYFLFPMSEITPDERPSNNSSGALGRVHSPSSVSKDSVIEGHKVGMDRIGVAGLNMSFSDVMGVGVGVAGIEVSASETLAREQAQEGTDNMLVNTDEKTRT